MRILRGVLYSVLAIVVAGIALLGYWIGPTTIRLMDRELLAGLPAGLLQISKPAESLAERQAKDGPLRYEEKFIPGADGDPPVRIVIVEPKDAAPGRPALLDIHGGGFTHGSPEMSLNMLVEDLVRELGVTAVSVDYRLAPGTRHPGALRDNFTALRWLHARAEDMGIDPRRIAVIGFSAGGGHAAMLSAYARDQGGLPIRFQALLGPMLDDRTGSTVDPGESLGRFLWTRENNRKAWTALLGVAPGGNEVPEGAVPMRIADLSGLPPTYVAVGTLDLFATESQAFADRLRAAGVPVELQLYAGGFHGFEFIVPSAGLSQQAQGSLYAYMRRQFIRAESRD